MQRSGDRVDAIVGGQVQVAGVGRQGLEGVGERGAPAQQLRCAAPQSLQVLQQRVHARFQNGVGQGGGQGRQGCPVKHASQRLLDGRSRQAQGHGGTGPFQLHDVARHRIDRGCGGHGLQPGLPRGRAQAQGQAAGTLGNGRAGLGLVAREAQRLQGGGGVGGRHGY